MSQSIWMSVHQTVCYSQCVLMQYVTCCPFSECNIVSSPVFFRVKMMTFPVWLNRGAPATNN